MSASVVTGDPRDQPASFSRFLLPFGYRRTPLKQAALGGPYWRAASATPNQDWLRPCPVGAVNTPTSDDRDRQRYLSHEVALVLFDRADWLVLEDPKTKNGIWRTFVMREGLRVNLRPPSLILLEPSPRGSSGCCEEDELRTGLLIFEAWFEEAPSYAALLQFNELFRYWRQPYENHPSKRPDLGLIASAILGDIGPTPNEDTIYTHRWEQLLRCPADYGIDQYSLIAPGDAWKIHADDRAFASICALMNEDAVVAEEQVLKPLRQWADQEKPPREIGGWLKLLNVDFCEPGSVMETSAFEQEWLAPRTYRRWLHKGTAYGYTSHSMAMLAPTVSPVPLWRHFGGMYFDQVLLMLYVRAVLFRFSESLSRLSAKMRDQPNPEDIAEFQNQFLSLRLRFDLFTNLYQYPLLSNQQQALEMYAILRKELDIETIYKEIHEQIDGTDEVIEVRNSNQLNRLAALLGIVGLVGAASGVAQVILSLWNDGPGREGDLPSIFLLALSFACSLPFLAFAFWLFFHHRFHHQLLRYFRRKP